MIALHIAGEGAPRSPHTPMHLARYLARLHTLIAPNHEADAFGANRRIWRSSCTHEIVVRLTKVPVTLPGGYPLCLNTMMKCADAPKDGVLDMNITGVMRAHRAGRRINFEEIFFWASSSFR